MFKSRSGKWIVCQIGAREHYAIPRALHQAGRLAALVTDFWCPPKTILSKLPIGAGLRDRWHPDLANVRVIAPNLKMLAFEGWTRARGMNVWRQILARNSLFQREAIRIIQSLRVDVSEISTLFSYSYASADLFRFARERGWNTVLGQIDPGPEEERIVGEEHLKYPTLGSRWQPAPAEYWSSWTKEIDLSNRIIINSEWSRTCLLKEGVNAAKLDEIPLVFERHNAISPQSSKESALRKQKLSLNPRNSMTLRVLFLGQINLRKGIGRLLDAMRMLKGQPIELTLAGPTEIDPSAWSDLPNVRWIGPIPRSEVGSVYQSSDIFILPTLSDGYAITQLEALAYDLPVMRSTNCGDPFTSDNTELLLDNLEPARISAALLRACQTSRTESGRAKARKFSLRDLTAKLVGAVEPETLARND